MDFSLGDLVSASLFARFHAQNDWSMGQKRPKQLDICDYWSQNRDRFATKEGK